MLFNHKQIGRDDDAKGQEARVAGVPVVQLHSIAVDGLLNVVVRARAPVLQLHLAGVDGLLDRLLL